MATWSPIKKGGIGVIECNLLAAVEDMENCANWLADDSLPNFYDISVAARLQDLMPKSIILACSVAAAHSLCRIASQLREDDAIYILVGI
ncbi:hypothetical protein QQP08_026236 [Theobroma cacao]|nr:hypothetical protein QQP08_026236 [Theobroma cacao]